MGRDTRYQRSHLVPVRCSGSEQVGQVIHYIEATYFSLQPLCSHGAVYMYVTSGHMHIMSAALSSHIPRPCQAYVAASDVCWETWGRS